MASSLLSGGGFLQLASLGLARFGTCAYLDPGTGSFILQMMIAGLVGGGFAIKLCWRRIVGFFRRRFSGQKEASQDGE